MIRTNAYFLITALIRTYAIWLGAQILIALPGTFVQAKSYGNGGLEFFLGIDAAVLLIATLVWIFADVIAKFGIARPQQTLFESDMPRQDWQAIFFATIGLWLLVRGIVDFSHEAARWFVIHRLSEQYNTVPSDDGRLFAGNVSATLEAVIGIGLMLGGRGLVGLLERIRGRDSMRREEGKAEE